MKKIMGPLKLLILFGAGGFLYVLFELIWRGYSHWTMFILGGILFIILGLLNEYKLRWNQSLLVQSIAGAVIVTAFEFVTGCVVNLFLGWNVWDYSQLPFNLLGQICLYYFFLWIPLSAIGIVLDDYLRYWWFGEAKPHYRLF